MKNINNKDKLFAHYNQTNLPTNLIAKDCLKHKEFLFNDNSMKPVEKPGDLSMAFVVEEKRQQQPQQQRAPTWRTRENEREVRETAENRFENTMVEETPKVIKKEENINKKVSNVESTGNNTVQPFEPLKIENLFLMNKKFNYPIGEGLWYIINPVTQQLYGPLPSTQIGDMYESRLVDGNWTIRPIDIFQIQSVGCLKYTKLTIINNDDWVSEVIDSQLLKYTELYKLSEVIVNNNNLGGGLGQFNINNTIDLSTIKPFDETMHNIVQQHPEPIQPVKKEEPIVIRQAVEADEWEVVNSKKKKTKQQEKEEYVIGVKKEVKKEEKPNKFGGKVEIISGEELLQGLKPKNFNQKEQEVKPVDLEKLGFQEIKKKKK
jgi:hypothetical protein